MPVTVIAAIAVASIGLGFASPFIAGLVVPVHDDVRYGLLYAWFYGIPVEVLGLIPLQDGNSLVAAVGVFMIQYAMLFTVMIVVARLVKWTFSDRVERM